METSSINQAASKVDIKQKEPDSSQWSSSVNYARERFRPEQPITSWELVRALFQIHPEYGKGIAGKLAEEPGPQGGEILPVMEWLKRVRDLFDPALIDVLPGRVVIYGLSRLDKGLQDYLDRSGFLSAMEVDNKENEKPPFESLLRKSPVGQAAPTPAVSDPTVLSSDDPSRIDQLGRKGFADALATFLDRFWSQLNPPGMKTKDFGHSFTLHLHGPWGSGKTTLLNLLQESLKSVNGRGDGAQEPKGPGVNAGASQRPEWVVVSFNAWQHQHLTPVWWPLMDRVYRDALNQVEHKTRLRFQEQRWRFLAGHSNNLIGFLASIVALVGVLIWLSATKTTAGGNPLEPLENIAKSFGAILAALSTIWTGAMLFSRSLFAGSASSAQAFIEFAPDPMEKVRSHYQQLITWIGRPVMVLIDDLDRCKMEYVIALLEGIQTLFNDSRVFYVIAADRRWLTVCFETEYSNFKLSIQEPGRNMGYLFLEKAFQLSVSVPYIPGDVLKFYLDYLIRGKRTEVEQELKRIHQEAEQELQSAYTIEELIARTGKQDKTTHLKEAIPDQFVNQIWREAAVRQSASSEVEVATTYFLEEFAPLMEQNPRAMKRLVTAYGIYRALAMLTDISLVENLERRKELALWTIVQLRWPLLAEYLEKHPEKVDVITGIAQDGEDDPEFKDLRDLALSEEVKSVFNGQVVATKIDQETVRRLMGIKAASNTHSVLA
jgi:hypothetical protein